ncbi:hypothetical protein MNBD_GAMMA26-2390 [hydrothermal vent metagenome]|uniref:Cytochrome c7-like domain-containing protein n=1 Tax=hydrothermal vent metagenome TaxID=652676 RepID=A0A3B1BEX9_9ZZZZ
MIHKFFFSIWLILMLIVGGASSVSAREYADIYMDSTRESMEKADVKAVLFPHWFHRIRFKCKVCHENIFIMKRGHNNVSMRRIMEGEACGVCHNGQIAWEALYCERCHSAEFEVKKTANAAR